LRRMIGEDIQLVTQLADDLSNTVLDPDQLSQIVFNLAVNARDAMPNGGTLQIRTLNAELDKDFAKAHPPAMPGEYVLLSVGDSGTGISRADLPRVFDPFFTTKEKGKGTGLGLSIVYGIVKQSGGYIWVYSEPGQGTTFKIYFPITRSAVSASPKLAGRGHPNGQTILIVEDEGAVRGNVRDCLKYLGYRVLEADSGGARLEFYRQVEGKIDLVLADLVVPGGSGYEIAQELAARFPDIPLLFTSGYARDSDVWRDLLGDDQILLEKPYTVAGLGRAVQHALNSKRRRDLTAGTEQTATSAAVK